MSILDEMTFYAVDENFDLIEVLDGYSSMIWTELFNEVGDFEVHGPDNSQLVRVMTEAKYIYNNLTGSLMEIEDKDFKDTEEDGATITLSGRAFEGFIDRRVILRSLTIYSATLSTKFSTIIKNMIENAFSDEYPEREWDQLTVVDSTSVSSPVLASDTPFDLTIGENVLDLTLEICKGTNIGFKTTFNVVNKMTTLTIYEGVNRVAPGSDFFVFSTQYDNLESLSETISLKDHKTAALVVGEVVGTTTKLPYSPQLIADPAYTGLNRRETFIEVDQNSQYYDGEGGSDGTMLAAEYISALLAAGELELSNEKYKPLVTYEGSIIETETSQYGVNYNIGDVIGFRSAKGTVMAARISGMTFSDDSVNGPTLVPMFNYEDITEYE